LVFVKTLFKAISVGFCSKKLLKRTVVGFRLLVFFLILLLQCTPVPVIRYEPELILIFSKTLFQVV
jgi:hypothetical protein